MRSLVKIELLHSEGIGWNSAFKNTQYFSVDLSYIDRAIISRLDYLEKKSCILRILELCRACSSFAIYHLDIRSPAARSAAEIRTYPKVISRMVFANTEIKHSSS